MHRLDSADAVRSRRVVAIVRTRFGTDGIRGRVPEELGAEQAFRVGAAVAEQLRVGKNGCGRIVVGHDPRCSSDMLEAAVIAGICTAGADVERIGVMPTPAVALLTRRHGADGGVMISASHNTAEYNGIKCFDAQGYKLTRQKEGELETRIRQNLISSERIGRVRKPAQNPVREYTDYLSDCVSQELSGLRVLFDCANGAASATIARLIRCLDLRADVIGCYPDGENINQGCGSTNLSQLQEGMACHAYDVGFAFDGDADRCIAVDESGEKLDGDVLLGVFAQQWKKEHPNCVACATTTVLSNLGLRTFLQEHGITTAYTDVGDRQVMQTMRQNQSGVGGEPSGHMIFREYGTTGDGQLTAIRLLEWLATEGMRASELRKQWKPLPQIVRNVSVPPELQAKIAASNKVRNAVAVWEKRLEEGRLLVRPSGTEAVVRVMAESSDEGAMEQAVASICCIIRGELE